MNDRGQRGCPQWKVCVAGCAAGCAADHVADRVAGGRKCKKVESVFAGRMAGVNSANTVV